MQKNANRVLIKVRKILRCFHVHTKLSGKSSSLKRIVRPKAIGSTALGAAYLAGIGTGIWASRADLPLEVDRVFKPLRPRKEADALFAGWRRAVSRVLTR